MANQGYDFEQFAGDMGAALNPAALAQLFQAKTAGGAYLGSLVKDKQKAAQLMRAMAASKSKSAKLSAQLMNAVLRHEAINEMRNREAPSVLVNLYFPAIAAGGYSAAGTASVRTPYSSKKWALTAIETFCTASPDPCLLTTFNPGGVDQAQSPTNQSVTWSGTASTAGIPCAKFGALNTQRGDSKFFYAPWGRRSRVFRGDDVFQVACLNASGSPVSEFVLLSLISDPCDGNQTFRRMQSVHPRWYANAMRRLHGR